jgi:acetyl-CoA synthetase
MGLAYPGHRVELVDEEGRPVPDGTPGEIVTPADAPTRFLGYLGAPEKEADMRLGPWLRTRDLAVRDAEGYFWHKGRTDDLIKSSGFRIGPTEIEDSLLAHPSVAECAVVGLPDPERGQVVAAFVRPRAGTVADDALAEALRAHVRARLAPYKAPRLVRFVEDFPMTSSGKINRRALREGRSDTVEQP